MTADSEPDSRSRSWGRSLGPAAWGQRHRLGRSLPQTQRFYKNSSSDTSSSSFSKQLSLQLSPRDSDRKEPPIIVSTILLFLVCRFLGPSPGSLRSPHSQQSSEVSPVSRRSKGKQREVARFSQITQPARGGFKLCPWDFPGGAVAKNPPAKAGDTGSSPGPGRSHMPRSN